jgi:lysozyme
MTETDDLLTARLIRHEGLRLKPYRDTVGKLTIGVGRNLDDVGLSRAEAMVLLDNDLARVRAALDARWPWRRALDPVRADAMVELGFNLGVEGLAAFDRFLAGMKAAAFSAAADALLSSRWAGEVGARANELADMVRTGVPT